MNLYKAARQEISDTIQHFANLYRLAKDSGLKLAFQYDRLMTELRHPGMRAKEDLGHQLGIVKETVIPGRDGYAFLTREVVTLNEALRQKLISKENYDAVIAAHAEKLEGTHLFI